MGVGSVCGPMGRRIKDSIPKTKWMAPENPPGPTVANTSASTLEAKNTAKASTHSPMEVNTQVNSHATRNTVEECTDGLTVRSVKASGRMTSKLLNDLN